MWQIYPKASRRMAWRQKALRHLSREASTPAISRITIGRYQQRQMIIAPRRNRKTNRYNIEECWIGEHCSGFTKIVTNIKKDLIVSRSKPAAFQQRLVESAIGV